MASVGSRALVLASDGWVGRMGSVDQGFIPPIVGSNLFYGEPIIFMVGDFPPKHGQIIIMGKKSHILSHFMYILYIICGSLWHIPPKIIQIFACCAVLGSTEVLMCLKVY